MKRILFYGNCQLGALSKHIRDSSDEYQILNCEDYGLKKFWADEGLFATWSPTNKDNQCQFASKVIEAVQTCDIFIFQHHAKKQLARTKELSTEYLCGKLSPNSIGVCVTPFQYLGYHYSCRNINPVLEKLYQKGMSVEAIVDYLKNKKDSESGLEMMRLHQESVDKLKIKDIEHKAIYNNHIGMSDFVELNYANKLIAYDHSHPSVHYYNELLWRLEDLCGVKVKKMSNMLLPGSEQICPLDMKYFNLHYPNMEKIDPHTQYFPYRLTKNVVERQIQMIKNQQQGV